MATPETFDDVLQVMDPVYQGWRYQSADLARRGMTLYDGWFFPYCSGVILLPLQYLGGNVWKCSWMSNRLPPVTFYVWIDGELVAETQNTEYMVYAAPGETLEIFIYDDPDQTPPEHYPRKIDVYWLRADEAASYRVEQYIGSEWQTVHVRLDTSASAYQWTSGILDDGETYPFRVVAAGLNENETILQSLSVLMVHRPDVQETTWEYDEETGTVNIAIDN